MTTAKNIVEAMICARAIADILAAGYEVRIDNGENETKRLADLTEILREMFTTDDETVLVYRKGRSVGWVKLVYGNDGFDVISDYTANLEKVLKPANNLSDRMQERPTDWLLDLLQIFTLLKVARDCIAYCPRNHPDVQKGDGFPIEIMIDAGIAKATGAA